jgi:glutathione reductase (NADPH)
MGNHTPSRPTTFASPSVVIPPFPLTIKSPEPSLGITSDGFFELEHQPKRVVVVGAGYIAVELAGIFNTLGSETHLLIRGDTVLRTFDPSIQEVLTPWMEHTGIKLHRQTQVTKVEGEPGNLTIHTDKGDKIQADVLLWAIGRQAKTKDLGLETVGVKTTPKGDIVVDEYQTSNVPSISSIGDVTGKWLLTPVAIAAGRRLANRLFGPPEFKDDKLSYDNIATVVFAQVNSPISKSPSHRVFVVILPWEPSVLPSQRPARSTGTPM